MPQSLKALCIYHGIGLVLRFHYPRQHQISMGSHVLTIDPYWFTIVGATDGRTFTPVPFGLGYNEADALASLVITLKTCMEQHGEHPAQNLLMVGRSLYDNEISEITLTPDLTV